METNCYIPSSLSFTVSKETAFVHALTSAFMVHIVTKACSDGILADCGCDTRLQGQQTQQGWQWGACSDDVDFGNTFARRFLDVRETEGIENKTEKQLEQTLVKLHNNGVGRKVRLLLNTFILYIITTFVYAASNSVPITFSILCST